MTTKANVLTCATCQKMQKEVVEGWSPSSLKYRLLEVGSQQGWCHCTKEAL